MDRRKLTAFAALGALLAAAPANAAIMMATWTTTIVSVGTGTPPDRPAILGPSPLLGTEFKLSYTYDTKRGQITKSPDDGLTLSNSKVETPLLSGSMSYGTETFDLGYELAMVLTQGRNAQLEDVAEIRIRDRVDADVGEPFVRQVDLRTSNIFGRVTTDFEQPFDIEFGGGGDLVVTQLTKLRGLESLQLSFASGDKGLPNGRLTVVRLDDVPAPVPEPAAWALMIMGFGLAGGGLRHRRKSATA